MNKWKPHRSKNKYCGAKTRQGTPCRRFSRSNGRCSLHGGKSPRWFAHPNYKHGRYSKYSGIPQMEKAQRLKEKHFQKRIKAFDKAIEQFIKMKGRAPSESEATAIFFKVKI